MIERNFLYQTMMFISPLHNVRISLHILGRARKGIEGEIWIQVLSMTCMLITQINSGMVSREKKLQSKLVIKQVQEWESYRRNFTKRTFILC